MPVISAGRRKRRKFLSGASGREAPRLPLCHLPPLVFYTVSGIVFQGEVIGWGGGYRLEVIIGWGEVIV